MRKIMNKLYVNLMLKYLLFVLATIVAIFGMLISLEIAANRIVAEYASRILTSGCSEIIYSKETNRLELDNPINPAYGIEILENNRVIYREGPQIGGEQEYSQEEIRNMLYFHYRFMEEKTYLPEYTPFTGMDGKAYVLLIKKPKKPDEMRANIEVSVPEYLRGSSFEKELVKTTRNVFVAGLLFLVMIVFLLSHVTSRNIMSPLKSLKSGLERINDDDLRVRLDFTATEEFEWVRDAFNDMAGKLEKAESEKNRIAESKKQFLLDISHDLRTPIMTIKGYSEAILEGVVTKEKDKLKYLTYINNKSNLISQLIERLFDYSKLESGLFELKKTHMDLNECFRNVIINYYGEMEEKGFDIQINIPDTENLYQFDETELSRAMSNLISNAIKYNPPGTKLYYGLSEDDDYIELTFKDDGIGIDPEIKDRVFDVMVRGDASRHKADGSGLGLAIAKKIIELHGGTIELESELGKGTEFRINLKKD